MKYNINLFGNNIDCEFDLEGEQILIKFNQENQRSLQSYLKRVLTKYNATIDVESASIRELIQEAIKIEKSIDGRMSEPKIKLPYEFNPEIKEKLIECADLQDISATQLLIRLIDQKYHQIMS